MNYNLTYNGLSLGPGTPYGIVALDGLLDLPTIRATDVPRAFDHGSFVGVDLMSERTILIKTFLWGNTPNDFDNLALSLQAAFAPQPAELPLVFGGLGGIQQQVSCRPRKRAIPIIGEHVGRAAEALIQLVATDPLIYSAALYQSVVSLPVTSGGLTFPVTFPATFGTATAPNTITATNSGTIPTPWQARVTGPLDNPVIANLTTGASIQAILSLGASDVLTFDSRLRTVLLNGASRRNALTPASTWFQLPVGATQIQFQGVAGGTGQLTFSWRNAWA